MKSLYFYAIISIAIISCTPDNEDKPSLRTNLLELAESQLTLMVHSMDSVTSLPGMEGDCVPVSVRPDGSLIAYSAIDWRSGFYPGCCWYMYMLTGKEAWKKKAEDMTWKIESVASYSQHDLGFMFNSSFGHAYHQTKDSRYKDILLIAANTLAGRYSEKVGCLLTWDPWGIYNFPVLIDAMMNLELLFKATRLSGDSTYWKIADSHALKTMQNHFRENSSSYHIVSYNPDTGEPEAKFTKQGYSDSSYWSRGQSWGLYGFTMCYRYTRNPLYLERACNIADFLLSLPYDDKIPFWDMKDPNIPNTYKDASAAAIMASALLELCGYVDGSTSRLYRDFATKQIERLGEAYTAKAGTYYGFQLLHSTSGKDPSGDTSDKPAIYADYYYLESLYRLSILK